MKKTIKHKRIVAASLKKLLAVSLTALFLSSCDNGPGVPRPDTGIPSDLQDEIDRTVDSNNMSANNAINQAKVAYGELAGRLNSVDDVDIDAYQRVRDQLQPPLFIVANSLSSSGTTDLLQAREKTELTEEFRELYFDTLTHMFRGINNNVLIYQASIESAQTIDANDNREDLGLNAEAIKDLSNIFLATEVAEYFIAQFGQFPALVPADETNRILTGIKNQQTTVINGIINFVNRHLITIEQAKNGYQIIAQSLTSPTLLPQLQRLAVAVFGLENVAFLQDEITPSQPNPNLIVMVIRESDTIYRKISINNGRVVNTIANDTRGLSAADLLNNSNVNVIKM